ncbi:MAG TPA: ATP synthase F1 subunit epsilon [Gemmatimonadales bacterium]|jgi:F-type H+-transporting ATPase subunit epsilon|nr:ATP synthase F1 subunit epsilon [Gemmatimonadales bacterium]
MHVTVISPEAAVYEGEATAVTAPAFDGEVGILTNHAPLMTVLGNGVLTVRGADTTRRFRVHGGFLQVVRNNVRVLAERVERDGA